MQIDLAFFDGDVLLARGSISCGPEERIELIAGSDHEFEVTHQFEEPSCPVTIVCRQRDRQLYKAGLQVGVHTSEDWESINLGNIHTLGFRCSD